jgi:hypothetical protein
MWLRHQAKSTICQASLRHMDEVEQGGKAAGAPLEQPEDACSLAA